MFWLGWAAGWEAETVAWAAAAPTWAAIWVAVWARIVQLKVLPSRSLQPNWLTSISHPRGPDLPHYTKNAAK